MDGETRAGDDLRTAQLDQRGRIEMVRLGMVGRDGSQHLREAEVGGSDSPLPGDAQERLVGPRPRAEVEDRLTLRADERSPTGNPIAQPDGIPLMPPGCVQLGQRQRQARTRQPVCRDQPRPNGSSPCGSLAKTFQVKGSLGR